MTIPISELQDAVRKQLDEFAEQLTVDESLTPVSTCMLWKGGWVFFFLHFLLFLGAASH